MIVKFYKTLIAICVLIFLITGCSSTESNQEQEPDSRKKAILTDMYWDISRYLV